MNPDLEKELAEASGEQHWNQVRPLELNEVTLNGDADATEVNRKLERKGGYFRKRVYVGHRDRNQKPEEMNLGKSLELVILRKRRKLVERGEKGKIVRSTNEHNHPKEAVTLYRSAENTSETGVATDLRKSYPQLRTVEVIYALVNPRGDEPELVRFVVKGASLGSEAKADDVNTIYSYLGSFTGKEHAWQYYTELAPVVEQGQKTYFAIDFKRGEKIDDDTLANVVAPALRKVRDNIEQVDKSRATKIAQEVVADEEAAEEVDESEDQSISDGPNPDDIPF
jgi:hypothetical protein